MENASKALEMAAGVLLAVLIMTLVAYFFTEISSWPEQEDDEKSSVQTSQFNLEYEVYDKKGMYGADVISCLTKAINNNEKYYEGENFLSGQKYGETYWVNVFVNIKSDLKEEIIVYHLAKSNGYGNDVKGIYKQEQRFSNPLDEYDNDMNLKLGIFEFDFDNGYTDFKDTDPFNYDSTKGKTLARALKYSMDPTKFININPATPIIDTENGGKKYNCWLYKKNPDGSVDTDIGNKTPLQILVNTANSNLKQIVQNDGTPNDYDGKTYDYEVWSSAEWRTALYDFKTRRFRCDNIKYNKVTGRVNELYFSEI